MARQESPLHGPSKDPKPTALEPVHQQHCNIVPHEVTHGFEYEGAARTYMIRVCTAAIRVNRKP